MPNLKIRREVLDHFIRFCTSGLKVYPEDKDFLETILTENLSDINTLKKLSFFSASPQEEVEAYFSKKREDTLRVYAKYFHSYSRETEDGGIYNSILDMRWNRETRLWERVSPDGQYEFTAFLPYNEH